MAGLDNKISNIIGTKLPNWIINQLGTRSVQNTKDSRDNNNLVYLANKSSWVRLVSSIDVNSLPDLNYFKNITGANLDSTKFSIFGNALDLINPNNLAKQYVLFGGTSKYLNANSYQQRSGLGNDGSYGMLGTTEIQKYGYKPMPGITSINIDTQGRLGSIRAATVNFKCWDKNQLDIIDALYFKLGFTMFLEWGHTEYYYSPENSKGQRSDVVYSTELLSMDPFQSGLTKDKILSKISKNSRDSEGNYDAMLGIVTNFNFTYTQDGGYDCTVRLMSLGVLGDSIKINNAGSLPDLLEEEIKVYNNTLAEISEAQRKAEEAKAAALAAANTPPAPKKESILAYLNSKINTRDSQGRLLVYGEPNKEQQAKIVEESGILNSTFTRIQKIQNFDFLYDIGEPAGWTLFVPRYGAQISQGAIRTFISSISLDINKVFSKLKNSISSEIATPSQDPYNENASLDLGTTQKNFYKTLFDKTKKFGSDVIEERAYKFKYQGKNGKDYYIELSISFDKQDRNNNINIGKFYIFDRPIDVEEAYIRAIKNLESNSTFNFNKVGLAIYDKANSNYNSTAKGKYFELQLTGNKSISTPGTVIEKLTSKEGVVTETKKQGEIDLPVSYSIKITDTDLISDIVTASGAVEYEKVQQNIEDQNKKESLNKEENTTDTPDPTQVKQALASQSSLELILRTIEVHSLNKAINKTPGQKDLEIGRTVYVLKIDDPQDKPSGKDKTFLQQIFSNGVYSKFISELVKGSISTDAYDTAIDEERFKIQSAYGFATSLMAGKANISELTKVSYSELMRAYVVPYQISQEIIKGTQTNHPVYIPLGLLLMILNHCCTIYDTNRAGTFQTPLIYIDYNNELNFCLTNNKQLSTNPWKTLIPFEGTLQNYKELFDSSILEKGKDAISPVSGSTDSTLLFNPETDDYLSGNLPPFKYKNAYTGKVMNILLNIDYVVKLVQENSYKDGSNNVYLKPFIEQILSDVNKYLGNFNSLRLSYNDQGNTFQIVDDQFIPSLDKEVQLSPTNTTEIPLVGKNSIAKSLEIKTDVSTKLANMIAISSNSTVENKSTLSTNGDSFGFINTNYIDRYIPDKLALKQTTPSLDTLKISAMQFNQSISDFYSKINPSEGSVSHATNYYIDKMSKIKNNDFPTRASALIPVSINFTTDGIGGLSMGQAFSVSDELLPYTYTTPNRLPDLPKDRINNVGFVIVGLTHRLDNNQWNTEVRANMIFLKEKTDFEVDVTRASSNVGSFGVNTNNEVVSYYAPNTNFVGSNSEAKKAAETYLNRAMTDLEWNQLVAATYAEASGNQTERAWVMAVILNRTRTKYKNAITITDTLTKPYQFQAITGTKKDPRPSANYVSGPDKNEASSIYGAAINILSSVPKNYLYFTSNIASAYKEGTDIGYRNRLLNSPNKQIIGNTIFSITG